MQTSELASRVALLEEQVKMLQEKVESLEGFRAILEQWVLARWPEYEAHREEGM